MGWMWRKNKNNCQGTEMVIFTEMGKMSRFWEMIESFTLGLKFDVAYETCR